MTDFSNLMLLTKQGGFLKPFAVLLGWIMDFTFTILDKIGIPNIGLAIILYTCIVYLLMLPMTISSQKFSKLSAKINPEVEVIRKKYEGKTQDQEAMMKMNAETQFIYAKYGVSRTGTCIQPLIQLPLLFALYRVIYNIPAYVKGVYTHFETLAETIVNNDAGNFILTAKDAADTDLMGGIARTVSAYGKAAVNAGDSIDALKNGIIDIINRLSSSDLATVTSHYNLDPNELDYINHINNFCGLNVSDAPSYILKTAWAMPEKNWLLIIGVLLIPILSAVTQWINTKLMPMQSTGNKEADENTMVQSLKMMNNTMPIMSLVFCFTLPVGMGLYWIAGAVVRGIIMVVVNKQIDKIDIDAMVKKNIEKYNAKREAQGLPAQQINTNATINTKNLDKKDNVKKDSKGDRAAKVKESTDYYNNSNIYKKDSLASKAFMVQQFNDKKSSDNDSSKDN